MAIIEKFEDIEAWQMAREITREIYEITSIGKFSQDYVLRDQIRRAVVSISSNIAEGFERDGNRELINFLSIAKGSCGEVRSQLYLAKDQDYFSNEKFIETSEKLLRINRAIAGFMKYLRQSEMRGSKFKSPKPETLNPKNYEKNIRRLVCVDCAVCHQHDELF